MIANDQLAHVEEPVPAEVLPPIDHYVAVGKDQGIVWTALRLEVLDLLWRNRQAWGPYGLAEEMRKAGRRIYPNSLYRVLDSFGEAGLIVLVASRRRVLISPDPRQRDWAVLQCDACDRSQLVPFAAQARLVHDAAGRHGHATRQLVIECLGLCASCRSSAVTPLPRPHLFDLGERRRA